MVDVLLRVTPGDLAAVLILTVAFIVAGLSGLAALISASFHRYHERRLATSLILEMLDKGMKADDIVRVLSAAGLEDHGAKLFSLRERLRGKLGRLFGERAAPTPKP